MARAFGGLGTLLFRSGVKVQGQSLLRLRTVGARTGRIRHTILGWFPDREGSWIVVASNAGGRRHPGWAFNLAKSPAEARVDLGEGEVDVVAELLTGADRESVWEMVVDRSPGYGRYLEKTDRQIPLFRLTARG
jgi:deazaflavin-dependent oxidoreductase (nitroreductase family)